VVSGRVYLDASAAVKLILREPESAALRHYLARQQTVLSSRVLGVEVLRAVRRLDGTLEDQARAVLAVTDSVELDAGIVASAGAVDPPGLRSLDAIHLASGLSIGPELDTFVTYDSRQADAARALGLVVESPA
jgi:predicted nucleic acid-binding protein